MALRSIVKDGDPVLRKPTRPVKNFDARIATLLDDMRETLLAADGVGLAAPQVGILRRLCVVYDVDAEEFIELINPEIVAVEGEEEDAEGCLSFPGVWALVKRPTKVTVRAQDRSGEFFEITREGLTARAFCHELDHLDGVVFVNRMIRRLTEEEVREMREED